MTVTTIGVHRVVEVAQELAVLEYLIYPLLALHTLRSIHINALLHILSNGGLHNLNELAFHVFEEHSYLILFLSHGIIVLGY